MVRDTIARRRLLQAIGGGGIALLAGCSGGEEETPTTTPGGTTEVGDTTTENQGVISQGGEATVSYVTGVDDLNPLNGTFASLIVGDWMYSKLTTFNHDLELQPDLATDWESNSDADEWTFYLRGDAKFAHNGEQVTAQDVKASLDVIISEEKAPGATETAGPLDEVIVEDDQTVTLVYNSSYLGAPLKLSKDKAKILPQDAIENNWDDISAQDYGSGPFVLEDYEHNNYYNFTAYDDYYKTDEEGNTLPYLDELRLEVYEDSVAKVQALQDGRLDMIQRLSTTNADQLKANSETEIVSKNYGQWLPIVLTNTIEPLGNKKVRQAMKQATNKEAMAQAAGDYATPTQDNPLTPLNEYYADLEPKYGQTDNVDKAQTLLEEAGYGDGFELPPLWYSKQGNPLREPIALLFQEQMRQVGIDFELKVVTTDRWLSEAWNNEDYWYISNWGVYLQAGTIFNLAATSDAPWGEMKWENENFDQAVANAMQSKTKNEKQEYFTEAQKILRDSGGWIIPFYKSRLGAKRTDVQNFNVEPTVTRGLIEPVWLDR